MKTYFTRIDFDKDGSITRADFEGMAKRFIEAGKLADAAAKQLTDNLGAVSKPSATFKLIALNTDFDTLEVAWVTPPHSYPNFQSHHCAQHTRSSM